MKTLFVVSLSAVALVAIAAADPAHAEDVDGHYKGTWTSTGTCSGSGTTEMTIKDRSFTRKFGPIQRFEVTVGADGRVAGQVGQSSLGGTVQNGHVDIEMATGRNCRTHQVLDKG